MRSGGGAPRPAGCGGGGGPAAGAAPRARASRRRDAGRIASRSSRTTGPSFSRRAFAGFAKKAPVSGTAATEVQTWRRGCCRRVKPNDARSARRDAAGAARCRRRQRAVEMLLPHDVAGVVVDPVDVVRAAGHERHRHEERDAAGADPLPEPVHATRLVVECRLPLQIEAGLRERLNRDLVIGPNPRRALRVGERGEPLGAPASRLCERDVPARAKVRSMTIRR